MTEKECIFCKIIGKEIPSIKIDESAKSYAFLDRNPVHPGHTLIIPKRHARNLLETPENSLTDMIILAKKVAMAVKHAMKADGMSISTNIEQAAGQSVFHTHLHVIPRYNVDKLKLWPQQRYKDGEMEQTAKKIRSLLKP